MAFPVFFLRGNEQHRCSGRVRGQVAFIPGKKYGIEILFTVRGRQQLHGISLVGKAKVIRRPERSIHGIGRIR
ncbi:hypothetical protein, partial [Escherichia coli]|uniref:hypothetical protein n=1 Tax=Escherichia coli TaxID=562 RepID=UPI0019580A78